VTKYIKLEVEEVSGKLDEPMLAELRDRMLAVVDEKIQDDGPDKQKAVEQVDKVIEAVRSGGVLHGSTTSINNVIAQLVQALEPLPRAIRAIAQSIDRPAHIFELGGVYNALVASLGLLSHAKESLEEHMACEECKKAEAAPADPKVGQA